ncbi:MAG: hypothetical protein KAG84_02980 [Bacteroidales bacterium]|nr:hypothetical protein [Bacteroidales bacterium]
MDITKKRFVIIIVLSILLVNYSCEQSVSDEDCATYNYYDCNTLEPFEADLKLQFSITQNNNKIPFEIIEGKIEDGKTIIYDTATTSTITFIMPLPQYYTVKATYKNGSKTIYAIDGLEMKARSIRKCDSMCWTIPTFMLDLRLQ